MLEAKYSTFQVPKFNLLKKYGVQKCMVSQAERRQKAKTVDFRDNNIIILLLLL